VRLWRFTGLIRHGRRTPRGNPAYAIFADRAAFHHTRPPIKLHRAPLKDLESLDAALAAGTSLLLILGIGIAGVPFPDAPAGWAVLLAECAGPVLGYGEHQCDAAQYRQIAELCAAPGMARRMKR
jgi:hypothetical protein